jgi:hypothetical protein
MPAWCNSLPSSVKAWYTSAYSGGFASAFIDALATSPSLRIHLSSHQNLSDNDEILGDIPNTPPEPR